MEELPKTFEPHAIEKNRYEFWERSGFFQADAGSEKPPYSLVMPPPNVTGVLHMGHALVNTLQDVLVRQKRMLGFEVCWIPGTDHAGIATQTVVEKRLIAETGKRRKDYPREEFVQKVLEFAETSRDSILTQLRKLGCSCDWSRLAFTLDENRSRIVRKVFKKLFDEGLAYRGDYLVNWDPVTQTALADDEVEYEERASSLWYFRYPLADEPGSITVATTRPETMLGDTAVAVSPDDPRYASLIGKEILLPLTDRRIPIVADRFVDPSFGSGAVKITPAHDPNDYETGLRHNLPRINILTPDGKINERGGPFAGLSSEKARQAVVEAMQNLGLVEKILPHMHRVGLSYRSKAVIEPFLSKQWFIKMSPFKPLLRELVETKRVRLVPESWENTYFHWIDNLRDWCVSRQLWWGHRIPVWYRKENPEIAICSADEGLPPEVAADPEGWIAEEDVLDTWFSSALWPFSTLQQPESEQDFRKFYPNSVLVTGHDILFFWVARMIWAGCYVCGEPPFAETFLHGLIYGKSYWRQKPEGGVDYITGEERLAYDLGKPVPEGVCYKWEKMSKSKGNIIDPLEMIDTFGTDAVRMALCAGATQNGQIDLDRRKFEEYKNFANKFWNGSRFVFMNLGDLTKEQFASGIDFSLLTLDDKVILSLLNRTVREVNGYINGYHFDKATLSGYDFFWKDFCSSYVETSKIFLTGKKGTPEVRLNKQKLLAIVLCASIRLLHPMAPFITEEVFSYLKKQLDTKASSASDVYTRECLEALQAEACMVSSYPKVLREEDIRIDLEETLGFLLEIVYAVRNIRAEMQIAPGMSVDVHIFGESSVIQEHRAVLESLVKIQSLSFFPVSAKPEGFGSEKRVGAVSVFVPLPQEMLAKERIRLEKEKEKVLANLTSLEQKLSGEEFLLKAPKEVTEKLYKQKMLLQTQLQEITQKLLS